MKHILIAVVIGGLTIGLSIFVLSDGDRSYENDVALNREISIDETFSGDNYDLTPRSFDCGEYSSIDKTQSKYGCVLSVDLTNTTIFEQLLNLDGDTAVTASGEEFPSSDADSRQYIVDNGLTSSVGVEEDVSGGVFFNVSEGVEIQEVNIYESSISDPIVIKL